MENPSEVPTEYQSVYNNEYDLLMDSMCVSVSKHLLDEHFTLVWANQYYYELIGYPIDEYVATFHNQCDRYFERNVQDWMTIVDTVKEAILNQQPRYECIARMRNKSGEMMWIRVVGNITQEFIGGIQVSYTVMTNVSNLVNMRLEQTVTYNHIPGFIAKFSVGKQGFSMIDANDRFMAFFGTRSSYSLSNMETEQNRIVLSANYHLMREGKSVSFSIQAKDASGSDAWFQINAECIDWIDDDPLYLVVYIDITEITRQREMQEKTNAQLEKLAFVDPVTNGRNHIAFEITAKRLITSAPPGTYVLVWLDVQKFKLINDLFGIENGNRTLKYIYKILQKHLAADECVARLSADNFNLLLKAAPEADLEERLQGIAQNINSFNRNLERKYVLSMMAGVFPIEDTALPITRIQDRANTARKSLKPVNNNLCPCMFYSERARLELMREKEMENCMQDALDNREFIIHLQPKQSLKSETIAGAEALVRWQNPNMGLVPPSEFVPFFEKNKFIVEVDLYVFEESCRLLRKWRDSGVKPIPISVNMSRVHLSNENFLERYEAIRKRYDVSAELLEIELTETLVFQHPQELIEVIAQIHAYGYRCSMDDFGSGYSSLNILREINVDTLKLDRAFFSSGRIDNPKERDVLISVIDLAKKLKMTTVAEGVETEAQAEFLRGTTCDMLQGYVFSRPLAIGDFERMAYGHEIELRYS